MTWMEIIFRDKILWYVYTNNLCAQLKIIWSLRSSRIHVIIVIVRNDQSFRSNQAKNNTKYQFQLISEYISILSCEYLSFLSVPDGRCKKLQFYVFRLFGQQCCSFKFLEVKFLLNLGDIVVRRTVRPAVNMVNNRSISKGKPMYFQIKM
jgi:hypothetical protein